MPPFPGIAPISAAGAGIEAERHSHSGERTSEGEVYTGLHPFSRAENIKTGRWLISYEISRDVSTSKARADLGDLFYFGDVGAPHFEENTLPKQ
jgi:hypothetical protein